MIGDLSNHLWQSTLFVAAAGLLTVALRKNGAHIRHFVWLTASLKFLVPFSLLLGLGSQLSWTRPAAVGVETSAIETVSVVMDQIAQPFTDILPSSPAAPQSSVDWIPMALVAVWACGFAGIVVLRLRAWRHIRATVKSGTALRLPIVDSQICDSQIADSRSAIADYRSPIAVLSCPGLLEPGIVGLWRPTLLLPAGIETQLSPIQMEAVIAHELCHVRRRDNVTAAIHMIVEAVFWFHPLVWWIGARMVDERERACDEHVLRVLGKPEDYAEGILNVCKLYVESPLTCVSGVTGSNLKKRIEAIMVNHIGLRLNFARKAAITIAALAALATPIVVGMVTAPVRASARTQAAAGAGRFEVVSVKPCSGSGPSPGTPATRTPGMRSGGSAPWHAQTSPGRVYWDCVTLPTLVDQAYADETHPLLNRVGDSRPPSPDPRLASTMPKRVRGGPAWVEKDTFTIEAKAALEITGNTTRNLAALPPPMATALRAALEDRFQLKVRRETEQQDMFALRTAPGGLKASMKPTKPGDCVTVDEYRAADPADRVDLKICGRYFVTMISWEFTGSTIAILTNALSSQLDRYVLDETGAPGMFNFLLQFRESATSNDGSDFETRTVRALDTLGMKLQPTKANAEYLFIDRADRPTPDAPASGASSKMLLPIVASVLPQAASAKEQATAAKTATQKFEVASIKPCEQQPVAPGARGGGARMESSPGRLHISCFRLALLVDSAYIARNRDSGVEGWPFMGGSAYNGREPGPLKVRGGPSWVYNEQWTIEAKAPTAADEDTMMGPMLRALLEDRFQLKIHTEAEDVPMWTLTVAKGGLKIKPNKEGDCNPGRDFQGVLMSRAIAEGIKPTCGMVNGGPNGTNWRWEHGGQTLGTVAGMLSGDLGAAVLDRTGVTDKFNLMWEYGPDENTPRALQNMQRFAPGGAPPTAANIFTALEDQLGLKLEKIKSPRGYIVIDRAERPGPDLVGRADLEARPQRGLQDQAALRTAIVRKRP